MTGIDKIGTMTQSNAVIQNALHKNQSNKFANMLKAAQEKQAADYSHISSEQVIPEGRLNGDFKTGFDKTFTSAADKNAAPQGAAVNGAIRSSGKKIDKTSKLYEKSMELESFFVKMMVCTKTCFTTSTLQALQSRRALALPTKSTWNWQGKVFFVDIYGKWRYSLNIRVERHNGGRLFLLVKSLSRLPMGRQALFFRYSFKVWKRATAFTIKERTAIMSIAMS